MVWSVIYQRYYCFLQWFIVFFGKTYTKSNRRLTVAEAATARSNLSDGAETKGQAEILKGLCTRSKLKMVHTLTRMAQKCDAMEQRKDSQIGQIKKYVFWKSRLFDGVSAIGSVFAVIYFEMVSSRHWLVNFHAYYARLHWMNLPRVLSRHHLGCPLGGPVSKPCRRSFLPILLQCFVYPDL